MKVKTLAVIVGIMLAGSVAVKEVYHRIVTPENIPSSLRIAGENNVRIFSYISHGSLFRSAMTWYDRVIEDYSKTEDGDFKLVKKTTVTYHYPILGIGEMSTSTKTEVHK